MGKIILASASERRSRILAECGLDHEVVVSGADENAGEDSLVSEVVQFNAVAKAEAVVGQCSDSIVIGADTLVVHDEDVLGKPSDEEHARWMLKKFQGEKVEVYSGVCVINSSTGEKASGYDKSELAVASLTDDEVEKFFRLLGPYDKAGGFSIEGVGALLFDDIKGSYFNILGLSMMKLRQLFDEIGLDIAEYISKN